MRDAIGTIARLKSHKPARVQGFYLRISTYPPNRGDGAHGNTRINEASGSSLYATRKSDEVPLPSLTSKALKLAGVAAVTIALQSAASAQTFVALSSPGFTTETTSAANSFLTPLAPSGSVSSYSVLSTAAGFSTTATILLASTTSFTFLWGSPDSFNSVTDSNGVTVTGSSFSSGLGNNAESKLYTFFDAKPFTSLTFLTSGVAFELAVAAPVPEPETYALMLAGLAAMGFVARRRRNV